MKKFIFILLSTGILLSCGQKQKKHEPLHDKVVHVTNVAITGDAMEYLKVVDGDYTFKPVTEGKITIAVRFEVIKKYEKKLVPETSIGNVSLSPLDSSGAAIGDLMVVFRPMTSGDYTKFETLLKSKPGTQIQVNFQWNFFSDEIKTRRIIEQAQGFEITDANITHPEEASTTNGSANKTDSKIQSDENWDQLLDSYDAYVNSYIKLLKKAQKGDASAISEYPAMLENALSLQEKLQGEKGNLSASQLTRLVKIQAKTAEAAIEMQKK
jgi:hypothetical protein